jgi:hypothetical protein
MVRALGGLVRLGNADLAVVDISAGSEPFESTAARPAVA